MLGGLAFTSPWLLAALALLPAIWLLLRLTPPTPQRIPFPPVAILMGLGSREETPARTPWWLVLLRMAIAALIILALAAPVLNPAPELGGRGPLLLVVDDGWAVAPRWQARRTTLRDLLEQAQREARPVAVLRTAPDNLGVRVEQGDAGSFLKALPGWHARPWPTDHAAAAAALRDSGIEAARVFWLADGVLDRDGAAEAARELADTLRRLGGVSELADPAPQLPLLLREPLVDAAGFEITVERPGTTGDMPFTVEAHGADGAVLAKVEERLARGEAVRVFRMDLPPDLRNRIARLEVAGRRGIGTTVLFDERWRRRTVGIADTTAGSDEQPLLAPAFYIERALAPHAEIVQGDIDALLEGPLSLLVMPDRGRLAPDTQARLVAWIEDGGVVLRFAGPRLAATTDPLVPVPLRQGDRQLGGVMSWSKPLPLAPFAPDGPFAGLEPPDDALVKRQVLAEPGPDLGRAVLATLVDGTPIITGARQGAGWLILVHTTANTAWNSLPLSGIYVELMRRILAMAPGAGAGGAGPLRAEQVLDAEGRLQAPAPDLATLPAGDLHTAPVGPAAPAGLYLPADAASGDGQARLARNLQPSLGPLRLRPVLAGSIERRPYERLAEVQLAPFLLALALGLALLDCLVGYGYRGALPRRRAAGPVGAAAILLFLGAGMAQAQGTQADIAALTSEMRLAFVRTGIAEVDRLSEAGLVGLTSTIGMRTSIEAGTPVGVDPATDELALFPLLYWPVPPDHPDLPEAASDRIEAYLEHGGMILFDTGDAARLFPGQSGGGGGERRLGQILASVDMPPLAPVPADHVLTRSFYLLQDFPGRYTGQPVWVDSAPAGVNDGVAGVIVGAHDWAGAWAVDELGRPLLPVTPGGERQREMARRFGVNLVMYALTGNYKTDQVHIPALLERLGQ